MYQLKFLPEIEEDAIVGYSWYEEKPWIGRRIS